MTTRSHSKAKVSTTFFAVHEFEIGPFRQLPQRSDLVAIGGIADMANLRVHGISCFDDGTDRFSGGYFSRPSSTSSRGELYRDRTRIVPQKADISYGGQHVGFGPILLQKSFEFFDEQ